MSKYNLIADFGAIALAAQMVGAVPAAAENRVDGKSYIAPVLSSILADVPQAGVSARFAKGAADFGNVLVAGLTPATKTETAPSPVTPIGQAKASWKRPSYTPR